MDGWVGGLLDTCIGGESIIVTLGFVLVFLVVEVGPAAVADCCGGCCFNCFFAIGIGEMTRLFLRLVHDVVVDGTLFYFAFDLCLGISCFGFCLIILQ